MKLTELILELHTIMLEKGNLDVFVINGCGCCEWPDEPNVNTESYYAKSRPGVYLNTG
jgi:hypothetical protein